MSEAQLSPMTVPPGSPAISAVRAATAMWVSRLILVALMVVPLTYGNALGNVAIALGLVSIFVADRAGYRHVLGMPHIRMLVASFLLLGLSAVVIGGATKASLVAFDFTPFVLAIPVSVVFLRAPMPNADTRLPMIALAGTIVACGVSFFQYFVQHATRPGGWELSPIHFAYIAVTLGFMSAAGLVGRTSRFWPLFAAGPVLGLVAGIMSGTRAVLLVAGVQFLLALWFILRQRSRGQAIAIAAAVVVVVGAILLLAPALGFGRVLDFGGLLPTQPSEGERFGFRFEQYEAAIRSFFEAPLFGHGWRHQIESILPLMSPEARQQYAIEHWGYIHNDFLNMSVGMGIFGSIAWVLLMAYPPVAVLWARRYGALSPASIYLILTAWLGILLGGLTDVLFDTELTKTFYCFIPSAILMLTWRPGPPGEAFRAS
jgi:O-antigen ligase